MIRKVPRIADPTRNKQERYERPADGVSQAVGREAATCAKRSLRSKCVLQARTADSGVGALGYRNLAAAAGARRHPRLCPLWPGTLRR